jgi:hypothetical protein
MQSAALGLSGMYANKAVAKLEAAIAQAEALTKLSREAVAETQAALLKSANRQEKRALVEEMKLHKKTIDRLAGRTRRMGMDEAYLTGLMRAADMMATGYTRFGKKVSAADDGMVALAKAAEVEASSTFMSKMRKSRPMRVAQDMYRTAAEVVGDAAKYRYGTGNKALQEIASSEMGALVGYSDELGRINRGVDSEAGKVAVMTAWVTTTERVNGSFMNTFDELPMWDVAKPMFVALLNTGTRGKAFEALANAWLPQGAALEMGANKAGILHDKIENILRYGDSSAPKTKAKKEAGRAAARQMTFEEFMEKARMATQQVMKVGLKEQDAVAYGYAAMAISEANAMSRAAIRGTKLLDNVSPKTLAAVKRIGSKQWDLVGEDLTEAARIFAQLDLPLHQRKMATEAVEDLAAGLAVLADDSGDIIGVIPRQVMGEFDARIGRVVKELTAFTELTSEPSRELATRTALGVIRLINTSLIYGIVFAKPQMATNIVLGSISQVWASPTKGGGARAAAAAVGPAVTFSAAELGSHLPGIGKHIDEARAVMAAEAGVPLTRVLPGMTNAVYNPHLAKIYDPDLASASTKVEGMDFTYGEARRWLREEGVLTTFASSAGLRSVLRDTPQYRARQSAFDKVFDGVARWSEVFPAMMDALEQRMRVAHFLDMLGKGYSKEEAGRGAREAFYDWNSPLSSLEQRLASSLLMFWGFTRRALNQSARVITSTFEEAADDSALDIFIKSSSGMSYLTELAASWNLPVKARESYPLARFGHSYDLTTAAKEAMRGKDLTEEEEAELRRIYPWWAARAGTLEFMYNGPLSPTDRAFDQRMGLSNTHKTYTVPSGTVVDNMAFLTDQITMLVAAAYHREIGAGEVTMKFVEDLADLAVRDTFQPVYKELLNDFKQDKETYIRRGVPVKSRYDLAVLQAANYIPFLEDLVWEDAKDGGYRTSPGVMGVYKAMLPLSMELKRILEPVLNRPSIRDGEARWNEVAGDLRWLVGQWMGVGKERHHDPLKQLKRDTEKVKAEVTRQVGESERRLPIGTREVEVQPAPTAAPTPAAPAATGGLPAHMQAILDKG